MPKVLLTAKFIQEELICPENKPRIEYCDTMLPGLYIECRRTSPRRGTYYKRYKNDAGKTCHKKLGTTDDMHINTARAKAKKLKAEISLGYDPRAEEKARKSVPTLMEYAIETYLPYAKQRKRSWKYDESMLRRKLLPRFGDIQLDRLSRQAIQAFHMSLKEEGMSGSSCDHHIKLLRRMLNLAVDWEIISKNPADRIPLFREDNKKERYMTPKEQSRLVHILKTDSNRDVCNIILFLLSTGARVNEAFQAQWQYIDMDNRVWRIPATNSKSKKMRSVPLNSVALEVLSQTHRRDGQEYVFINRRTRKPFTDIKKSWMRLKTLAGMPELRLHDLRHQYASLLVNSGRSLYEVQQILGHSDPTVTQRYAHLSTATLQEAAESASMKIESSMVSSA
jgi:integrase